MASPRPGTTEHPPVRNRGRYPPRPYHRRMSPRPIRPAPPATIPADLTDAEQLLWEAFPRGAWVDLGPSPTGESPVIKAEVIAALLLGAITSALMTGDSPVG